MGILGRWIGSDAFAAESVTATVNGLIERQLRGYLPSPEGMTAEQWVPIFRQAVLNRRGELLRACADAAYAMAFSWHREFAERLEQMVGGAIATLGLPYARELVDRLRRHIDDVLAPGMARLGTMGPRTSWWCAPQVDAALRSLRGVMSNADQVLATALDGFRANVRRQLFADAAARIGDVMRVMGAEMLAPLRDALSEAMVLLEKARAEPPIDVGLARLSTDQYVAWPADADELVPARFAEANNEVLLISSSAFKGRYEIDLPKAVAGANAMVPLRTAIDDATTRVILGQWRTTGGVVSARWPDRAHRDMGDPRAWAPTRRRVGLECRRWRSSMCIPGPESCWRGRGCMWVGRARRSRSSARCRCVTSCKVRARRNRNWPPAGATSPPSSPRRCRSPGRWPA